MLVTSLKRGIQRFSKFYRKHSELIVKYTVGLKTFLQQCISEPVFYGDLVYKIQNNRCKAFNF